MQNLLIAIAAFVNMQGYWYLHCLASICRDIASCTLFFKVMPPGCTDLSA
jgi:hypothetical protein